MSVSLFLSAAQAQRPNQPAFVLEHRKTGLRFAPGAERRPRGGPWYLVAICEAPPEHAVVMHRLRQEALALFIQLSGRSAETHVEHHALMMTALEGGRRLQAERDARVRPG